MASNTPSMMFGNENEKMFRKSGPLNYYLRFDQMMFLMLLLSLESGCDSSCDVAEAININFGEHIFFYCLCLHNFVFNLIPQAMNSHSRSRFKS